MLNISSSFMARWGLDDRARLPLQGGVTTGAAFASGPPHGRVKAASLLLQAGRGTRGVPSCQEEPCASES